MTNSWKTIKGKRRDDSEDGLSRFYIFETDLRNGHAKG